MFLIRWYGNSLSYFENTLIDSILLIIISFPTLYFIVFYPLQKQLKNRNEILSKLKISELNFNKSILTIPDALSITEIESGELLEVNNEMAKLLEYSKEELIGRNTLDLFIWADPNQRLKFINKLKSTGSIRDYFTVFKSKNDRLINGLISCSIIDKDGVPCILLIARDVTQYKKELKDLIFAKETAENEKALFQGLFNNITIGLYQSSPEGEIFSANPALLKMLQFNTFEELRKKELTKSIYVNQLKHDEFKAILTEKGKITDFESQWYTKNGDVITVIEGALAVKDENGDIYRYDGFVQNITDLKKSEERIYKLDKAINNSRDVIFYTDSNGIITFVNNEFIKLYGYTEEEVIGKTTPGILKSGFQSKEIYTNLWDTMLKKQSITNIHFINKSKDGELTYVESKIDPILDDNGSLIGFVSIQRDITERKRIENIQNIILNISNASQIDTDFTEFLKFIQIELGKIVDAKNFFVALYNKENDTIHLPYYQDEKDHVADFPAKKTLTGRVISQGEILLFNEADIIKFKEEKIITTDGKTPEIWMGIPLKIKGMVTGAFVIQSYDNENAYSEKDKEILEIISHKISISIERKRSQEELIQALEIAKESDRLKSAFLANMSHEIRTPMNGILGFSDLLKNLDLSVEKQQKYLSVIEKSGQRLLNTINDIIDISKLEAGQIKVKLSKVDINKTLNELYEFLNPDATKKGLQLFVTNTLSCQEANTKSDEDKIYAVLLNLVKNAIKFTDEGIVEFGCVKKENYLEFYVKDTGIGIPLGRQQSVFERFIQADIEDKAVREGSGLGLTISKSYIELLDGTIKLNSKEGVGSTFYVTIPYEKIVDETVSSVTENLIDLKVIPHPKLKILIVEDDIVGQIYLEEILDPISNEILIAENGLEAIELYKNNPDIELILMDMGLPKLNGYDATREIRKLSSDVIIIAQTAFAFTSDKEKTIEAGCNNYISKPINKEKLYKLMNEHLAINN
jgi:PAS domain S-box-containing protein